jgi:hypothetical protein
MKASARNLRRYFLMMTLSATGVPMAQAHSVHQVGNEDIASFQVRGVQLQQSQYQGQQAFKMSMPATSYQNPDTEVLTDRAMLAWLPVDFTDGTIELDVASTLAADAPAYARGFIGVAFRIRDDLSFEGLYLRPANSQVDDQVRRNHSAQYFSYPDFDFARLRRESPEKYESYVDVALDQWTHLKIDVHGDAARLYVNHATRPALIVTDLKHGAAQHGGIGFWIESGTVGYFKNLSWNPLKQNPNHQIK